MSAGVSERTHHSSPLTQVVAEVVGISHMLIHGGIDLWHPHRYLQGPKKKEINIPDDAEVIALLIPGFGGPGTTMDLLAKRLTNDKVFATTWGDHPNIGPFPFIIEHVYDMVKELSEKSGKRIVVIGHSLGGNYALHALRQFPEYVEGAIILGSPVQTTLEGLADATVLGQAAKLLANEYVHLILHDGFVQDWGPEYAKETPQGWRFAVSASLDNIVDAFSTLLEEDERTRSVILKSDHCGLPDNELAARMIASVLSTKDVHTDFGDKINKRILTVEDLEKVNGLPGYVKVLSHMTRGHRHRMKVLGQLVDEAKKAGMDAVASSVETAINVPKDLMDVVTKPLLCPRDAEVNAQGNVFPLRPNANGHSSSPTPPLHAAAGR